MPISSVGSAAKNCKQRNNMAEPGVPGSLQEELTEAEILEKIRVAEGEHDELQQHAKILTKQLEAEAMERQVNYMKAQIDQLLKARDTAHSSTAVFNPLAIGDDETSQQLKKVLEMLQKEEEIRAQQKEEEIRKKQEEEQRKKTEEAEKKKQERKRREEEKQKQKEKEEQERLEKEEREKQAQKEREEKEEQECLAQEKEKEEKERLEQEKEKQNMEGKTSDDKLDSVIEWIKKIEERQKQEEKEKEHIRKLQAQIEEMTKADNRRSCQATGVNMFAGLDVLQGEGTTSIDLAAKAQAAMLAATSKRKRDEDEESDGESIHSKISANIGAKPKLQSGILVKSSHKVKFEVDWAHHWLGKEYEVNPVPFNQLKLSNYITGESDILLHCDKPEELHARLKLMRRIGYWTSKYDWPSARNVYAAIMRGIETGRENWNFDLRDYEDMLMSSNRTVVSQSRDQRKSRETYFCGPYQKGECNLDSPHYARIGPESIEKLVHHVCSTCLIKDGKKLTHPNGAQNCPRSKQN